MHVPIPSLTLGMTKEGHVRRNFSVDHSNSETEVAPRNILITPTIDYTFINCN